MQIDYKSRIPIYEQIMQNVKNMILAGVWKADDQLPSVRQLAQELGINPNTIQKAYNELEWQGVIYSLRGRGSFVSSNQSELQEKKKQQLLGELENTLKELLSLDISKEALEAEIQKILKKGSEQND